MHLLGVQVSLLNLWQRYNYEQHPEMIKKKSVNHKNKTGIIPMPFHSKVSAVNPHKLPKLSFWALLKRWCVWWKRSSITFIFMTVTSRWLSSSNGIFFTSVTNIQQLFAQKSIDSQEDKKPTDAEIPYFQSFLFYYFLRLQWWHWSTLRDVWFNPSLFNKITMTLFIQFSFLEHQFTAEVVSS